MRAPVCLLLAASAALGLSSCWEKDDGRPTYEGPWASSESPSPDPRARSAPPMTGVVDRSASALSRAPDEKLLYLADEDRSALRRIPLPVDVRTPPTSIPLPGRPAQVLALPDRILVTLRDPGMLLELVEERGELVERARVELPDDAWGLAVSADGKTAVVTSAWSHQISAVDLASFSVRWTVNAAREPRGVAIGSNGTAYVSHLVGSRITKIDDVAAPAPTVHRVEVAPSPLKSPPGRLLAASLGYTAVLSPDESRVLLPRHALGAQGVNWWFGAATVDVVSTKDQRALAPRAAPGGWADWVTGDLVDVDGAVALQDPDFVQPRAAIYRRSTRTLLVAGEGNNTLVELDALALDPSLATKRTFPLATYDQKESPFPSLVESGGAPSAIALSADEKTAWVYCRSTNDLMIVSLEDEGPIPWIHVADDVLDEDAQKGRKLFYDATDPTVSGGLGCAGCHPDGRDDGHVWHEIASSKSAKGEEVSPAELAMGYRGTAVITPTFGSTPPRVEAGFPRQTPMLAGRVDAQGPYGWRGEAPSLESRVLGGFALHRWGGEREAPYMVALDRPKWLAAFLRTGLVAPSVRERPLTPIESRGKAVFSDDRVGCPTCHAPATGYTNRAPMLLQRPSHQGFAEESHVAFKTPSLLFVGGTAPYYHDGAATSLEALVQSNGKTMGDTARLSAADKAALAAYLRTIGGYVAPFPEEAPSKLPHAPPIFASTTQPGRFPMRGEWNATKPFAETSGCKLSRLNDFFRLECEPQATPTAIAGTTVGVERFRGLRSSSRPEEHVQNLVMSVKPGDRRVIQLTGTEQVGKWGTRRVSTGLVQIFWLEGEAEPVVSIHRPSRTGS